ncbi:MAG: type II secretion system protein [Clostridia bacterium]|nr:type II secretion system protein [Clostridia bacterium]
MRNNKGFSLVELIVVIAIMAVLAAVAVIGVSIYIPKAQKQADAELLNVLSDALRAACLSEGVDPNTVNATIAVDANGKLATKADGSVDIKNVDADIASLFNEVFTEKNAKFNIVEKNFIKFSNGKFGWSDGSNNPTLNYGGSTIVLDQKDIDALKDSTFGKMGIETLLGQLDMVTGIAANLDSSAYMNVLLSEDFLNCALLSMGIEQTAIDDMTKQDKVDTLMVKREELAREALKQKGIDNPTLEQLEAAINQVQANAVVLYTAQVTAKMDSAGIESLLATSNKDQIVENMMSSDKSGDGIAQAAMMCGLYTSYVNSSYGAHLTEAQKEVNVQNVLDALENDDKFMEYIYETEQGKKDLEGYLGSLNMISSSTSDSNATNSLIVNGFADPDLIAGLNQATGK